MTNVTHTKAVFALAVVAVWAAPAYSQTRDGRYADFSLSSSLESTSNPSLTAGNDDSRTILSTTIGLGLYSITPTSDLSFNVGGTFRYGLGDVVAADEGFSFGAQTAELQYSTEGPRAVLEAQFSYSRDDLTFLSTTDLISDTDGSITIDTDFADISGVGTREDFGYNLAAEIALAVFAHFDVTPTATIDTRLSHVLRDSDATGESSTTTLNVAGVAERSDNLEVRGGLNYEIPDDNSDRLTVSAGFTFTPTPRSSFSADLGVTLSDDFDSQYVGSLSYDVQPTSTTQLNVGFNTNVTETIENEVVVDTAAVIGFDYELTALSALSFDAVYGRERDLANDETISEVSASLQINRSMTRDWDMSVGVGLTNRRETGLDDAQSEEVFFTIGRTWDGRF